MKKRFLVLIAVLAAVFVLFLIFRDKIAARRYFGDGEISAALAGSGKEKDDLTRDYIEKLKNPELLDYLSGARLDFTEAEFKKSGRKDIIISLSLGEKISYVALYEKNSSGWYFSELIDSLFEINEMQAVRIDIGSKDMLVVKELIDQKLGSFEESEYLRAYYYGKRGIKIVLSVLDYYDAYWNESWTDENDEPDWLNVRQKAVKKYIPNSSPELIVTKKQSFSRSKDVDAPSPYEAGFKLERERDVAEHYRWSERWEHFILSEAENKKTGEVVAVIEELSHSPYELHKNKDFLKKDYRILKENGEVEIVGKAEFVILESGAPKTPAGI